MTTSTSSAKRAWSAKLAWPAWALGAVACIGAPSVAAQDATPLAQSMYTSKHLLTLGAAQQTANATISATPDGFDTFKLSLKDLNIDNQDQSFYLEYTYRFRERWALVAGTYQFSGSGGRTTSRDFEYDGTEFTAGSTVNASLEVDAYIFSALYRFHASERFEFMAGGGIHALDLGAALSGQVRINETEGEFRQAGSTLLAPVPNLRAMALWTPADRFAVRLNAGWLSAKVEDYDGSFAYMHLRGSYEITDKLGVALGYQFTDIDITQDRSRSTLAFEVEFDGPTLTFSYAF